MAEEMRKARKKTADMTNVKDRGPFNQKHMAEGDYSAKIVAVYDQRNKDDTKDMWVIAFQLQDRRDVVYPYYCTWDENQLWKLRNVFEACGVKIPKKRVSLDPDRILNKVVGITLEDDEYQGKPKSVIASVMSLSSMENGPDSDDDDVEDDDDIEDEEIEETPPPRKRRKKAPEPEPEDDDEDDEDDEEEPEPPRRKKKASPSERAGGRSVRGATRAAASKKRRVVEDDEDDDLDEMDIDEEDL